MTDGDVRLQELVHVIYMGKKILVMAFSGKLSYYISSLIFTTSL